jgi:hypothetical protein
MLQMFHLDVSEIDQVLHMVQWRWQLSTIFPLSANSLTSATALSWQLSTIFPLSANSLTSATALSWVTISSGAWPPRTTQMKGMAAGPPETTQSRGMAARPHEMTQSSEMACAGIQTQAHSKRCLWSEKQWI